MFLKFFIVLFCSSLLVTPVKAAAIRYIDDKEILLEKGFEFKYSADDSGSVIRLLVKIPKSFVFESGGEKFEKPLMKVSFVQTEEVVSDPTKLLSKPSLYLDLETKEEGNGSRRLQCKVLRKYAATSYLVATFASETNELKSDWPVLVYIPISVLVTQ